MIDPQLILAALVALVFAGIHVGGGALTFLRVAPRSVWLSMAGGVSVSYVFVHLLPELAEYQETLGGRAERAGGWLSSFEHHVYIIALIGLGIFYGLDRLARQSGMNERKAGRAPRPSRMVFWIHLGSFAIYNCLIGYLLVHREETDLRGLAIYAVAMALHFVVNDQGLRDQHGEVYDAKGRWLLAAAPLIGFGIGAATIVSPVLLSALFAFLAGGVVLNVLKEELPEDRESRFWAFAAGTAAYTVLLLATG